MYFESLQNENVAGVVSTTWGTFVPASTHAFDGLWTWTPNSTLVNELRGGLAYLNNQTLATDANVNPATWGLSSTGVPTGYGIPPGVNLSQFPLYGGSPELQIGSFSILGSGNKTSERGPEGSIDIVEHSPSYLRGKHAFKFGFEYLDAIFDGDTYNQGNGGPDLGQLAIDVFVKCERRSGRWGPNFIEGNPQVNMRSWPQLCAFCPR